MEEKIRIIKEVIENLLFRLTIDASVDVLETANGPQFIIKTHEGGLVIGENGKNLVSFNHLVKKIISKRLEKDGELFHFSLDVNDYQSKKIEELKNVARLNAQRVRYFKKEIALRSMSSFERRIVHMTLQDCPDIITDSRGEEPQRKVVIMPYP